MYFNLALSSRLVSTSEFWELRVADLLILSAFFGLKHARLYHLPRCGMDLHHWKSNPVHDVGAEKLENPPVFFVVYILLDLVHELYLVAIGLAIAEH